MLTSRIRLLMLLLVTGLALAAAAVVFAVAGENKPYQEGQGGLDGRAESGPLPEKPYAEGEGYDRAGSLTGPDTGRPYAEGAAGPSGRLLDRATGDPLRVPEAMSVIFRFSGAADDGEQGGVDRKEATAIHCTNTGVAGNNVVLVELYQWNGTDVYTGTATIPPNATITFSTQNTTIYFDDVTLGGIPGTPAIFQGSGRILAEQSSLTCTAQVLDPLGYPPAFVTSLTLFR